jgi:hypothetical protein
MKIEAVSRLLESLGARYALIGAHAMAARGYPRFTVDVDILTADARVLDREAWAEIEDAGGTVDARRGDPDDPLGGVVHIRLADGSDIDVIVGKWKWEARAVERAEPMSVGGVEVPVARTSDLILLKLAAGGYGDLRDAAMLLATGDREALVRAVETHIAELPFDIRPRWQDLLRSTSD